MGRFYLVAIFLLLLFFSFLLAYFLYGLQPVVKANGRFAGGANPPTAKIKIERGDGLKEIVFALSQKKLIRSAAAFKIYALISGAAHRLKPGVYEVSAASSTPEIISVLAKGRAKGIAVLIPEGATLKEIDRLLSEADILKAGEFAGLAEASGNILKHYSFRPPGNKGLEGFLFPDTYYFSFSSAPADVLRSFLDNFEARAWPLLRDKNGWYEILVKASLLEKEVASQDDRRLVSGVIDKRLENSMPLQIDATLVYEKCRGDFSGCKELLLAKNDFNSASLFNTYKNLGFPPSPISNPGLSALKAALEPRTSAYWYYLSDRRTKKTYFSKTFDEHNDYRAKYLNL